MVVSHRMPWDEPFHSEVHKKRETPYKQTRTRIVQKHAEDMEGGHFMWRVGAARCQGWMLLLSSKSPCMLQRCQQVSQVGIGRNDG